MANNQPEFITATDLIREWFQEEASEFKGLQAELMVIVGEWILAAYLRGHEDGYEQGFDAGHGEGYDEGYHDAQAECDSYD